MSQRKAVAKSQAAQKQAADAIKAKQAEPEEEDVDEGDDAGDDDDDDEDDHNHGHSHAGGHGHSHGEDSGHSHSHGPQQSHGHSHGGQPCGGHGGPKATKAEDEESDSFCTVGLVFQCLVVLLISAGVGVLTASIVGDTAGGGVPDFTNHSHLRPKFPMAKWIEYHGGWVDWSSLEVKSSNGYRGMYARRDIDEETELYRLPDELILHERAPRLLPETKARIEKYITGESKTDNSHDRLALVIKWETEAGRKSFFWPYLSDLPANPPLPGRDLGGDAALLKRELEGYTELASYLTKSFRRMAKKEAKYGKDFMHYLALIYSRVYAMDWHENGVTRNIVALYPFIDLANHKYLPWQTYYSMGRWWMFGFDCWWDAENLCNGLKWRAPEDKIKGEEIFNSYSSLSADGTLATYGFVAPNNVVDCVEWKAYKSDSSSCSVNFVRGDPRFTWEFLECLAPDSSDEVKNQTLQKLIPEMKAAYDKASKTTEAEDQARYESIEGKYKVIIQYKQTIKDMFRLSIAAATRGEIAEEEEELEYPCEQGPSETLIINEQFKPKPKVMAFDSSKVTMRVVGRDGVPVTVNKQQPKAQAQQLKKGKNKYDLPFA